MSIKRSERYPYTRVDDQALVNKVVRKANAPNALSAEAGATYMLEELRKMKVIK